MTKLEQQILSFIYQFNIKTVRIVEIRFFYIPKMDTYRSIDNLYLNRLLDYQENSSKKGATKLFKTEHGSYEHSNLFVDKLEKWKERFIGFVFGVVTTLIIRYLSK